MTHFPSQWDSLLRNLGAWQGSFTRLSADGTIVADTPSITTLAGLNSNQTIRQTIQHFVPETGEPLPPRVLEYSSLGRGVLFFEDGAFSQGSIQLAPFTEFGAEFGFVWSDRRLRLVQLFDKDSRLASFTLIREHQQSAPERPPLTVDRLLGDWQGEAVTLYPDWSPPRCYQTELSIWLEGDRLHQRLTAPQLKLASSAAIEGAILRFDQGSTPMQVLLLPDGASANTPLTVPRGQSFLLEAGWLLDETTRLRMIRSYDARGGWVSLTRILERKSL